MFGFGQRSQGITLEQAELFIEARNALQKWSAIGDQVLMLLGSVRDAQGQAKPDDFMTGIGKLLGGAMQHQQDKNGATVPEER